MAVEFLEPLMGSELSECMRGNHIAGCIGSVGLVRQSDRDQAVADFELVIEDFNVRGQREQVAHPGWCTPAKFCVECGARLE